MSRQALDTTTNAGDTGQAGGNKINAMTLELYGAAPRLVSGNWYGPYPVAAMGGASVSQAQLRFIPLLVTSGMTITGLGVRNSNAQVGNVQLGLFASDPATFLPTGAAIDHTASISTNSNGFVSAALGAARALTGGSLYWLAHECDTAGAQFHCQGASSGFSGAVIGSAAGADVCSDSMMTGLLLSGGRTFGDWTSVSAGTFTKITNGTCPLIAYQVQ